MEGTISVFAFYSPQKLHVVLCSSGPATEMVSVAARKRKILQQKGLETLCETWQYGLWCTLKSFGCQRLPCFWFPLPPARSLQSPRRVPAQGQEWLLLQVSY